MTWRAAPPPRCRRPCRCRHPPGPGCQQFRSEVTNQRPALPVQSDQALCHQGTEPDQAGDDVNLATGVTGDLELVPAGLVEDVADRLVRGGGHHPVSGGVGRVSLDSRQHNVPGETEVVRDHEVTVQEDVSAGHEDAAAVRHEPGPEPERPLEVGGGDHRVLVRDVQEAGGHREQRRTQVDYQDPRLVQEIRNNCRVLESAMTWHR